MIYWNSIYLLSQMNLLNEALACRHRLSQDSQFLVWHVEVYRLSIVAGEIDFQGVQIPNVCLGLLNRFTTTCSVPGE